MIEPNGYSQAAYDLKNGKKIDEKLLKGRTFPYQYMMNDQFEGSFVT